MVERALHRQPSLVASVLVLVVASFLQGCGSGSGASEIPPAARKVRSDPPALTRSRIGQAESLMDHGDYQGALAALKLALNRAGDPVLRHQIQELRLGLKRRAIGQVLESRVTSEADWVITGGALNLDLELLNHGTAPVTISRSSYRSRLLVLRKEVGRTVFDLKFTVDEFDPRGTRMVERFNRFWEPEEDIVIEAGGRWSHRYEVDTTTIRPHTALLKRIRVKAVIRPVRVRVGEQDFFTAIPMRSVVVYLLPRGAQAMVPDPFKHLNLALLRGGGEPRFLPHVLVAACILEGEDRERGHKALTRIAEGGPGVLRPSAKRALDLFWKAEAEVKKTKAPAVIFKSR